MADSKLFSLSEAIDRFVPNGSSIALGTAQETLIPFAAGHEIMRQRKRNLTLLGPISDILFDQMIGAGCVSRIRAAWVGNVITGSGYNFRRAVEGGRVEVEDHSNLTMSMALRAAAMGVPFMPARTALGSSLYETNGSLMEMQCPFTGETLTAVRAIQPDLAIIHVQRADEYGNAHCWGNLGITREACLAARDVIITAEEIVEPEVIESDPNRVVTPGFRVTAVAHAPWGAHPSPVPGYYNRDHQSFLDYREAGNTEEAFMTWLATWIDGVEDVGGYRELVGEERLDELAIERPAPTAPADYGY
ncbi:MAG: CoA-transferase [Candidatus Promineifilaceae bacterium]|nr:CoA-transferase [Candidatus Promineifilaceae bacterium]